jgi:hypothetical protein
MTPSQWWYVGDFGRDPGAAGVDGQSIADFEADLTNNLYD